MEALIGYSKGDPGYSDFQQKYDDLGARVLDNGDGTSTVLLSDGFDLKKLGKDLGFNAGILEVR